VKGESMSSTRRFPLFAVFAVLLAAGCGANTREVELKATEPKALIYSATNSDKNVTVTVSSPDTPIDAYLCLEKDHEIVQGQMERLEKPTKFLDGQTNVKEATLQGAIPAGKEYAVVLYSRGYPKDTKVKLSTR